MTDPDSADVRDIALLLMRATTDTGVSVSLDDALTAFGFDGTDPEMELDSEL